jgi:predicted lipoprotein with Yx(FWY)xxD motif
MEIALARQRAARISRRSLSCAVAAIALLSATAAAPATAADRTKITVRGSEFGRMLWAPKRQAIYMFENDKPNRSRCYGRCAKAWPPVLTRGRPKAGRGVDSELLGTTKRRNGDRQVTYAGKPLYTYAHEGRGQVFCHDVDLNGGYWWVLDSAGDPHA